jgi:hypothetical protein
MRRFQVVGLTRTSDAMPDFRRPALAVDEIHFELHGLKLAARGVKIKQMDVGLTSGFSD